MVSSAPVSDVNVRVEVAKFVPRVPPVQVKLRSIFRVVESAKLRVPEMVKLKGIFNDVSDVVSVPDTVREVPGVTSPVDTTVTPLLTVSAPPEVTVISPRYTVQDPLVPAVKVTKLPAEPASLTMVIVGEVLPTELRLPLHVSTTSSPVPLSTRLTVADDQLLMVPL